MDVAGLLRVTHEASFDQDRGVLHSSENIEASPADASVGDNNARAFLSIGKTIFDVPMNRCCQGNIGRVLLVAGFFSEIRCFDRASIMGNSFRRQGEGFDSPGLGSGRPSDGVEMDADKNGIAIFVGNGDPLAERDEAIRVAGHHYFESQFAKLRFQKLGDLEIVTRLCSQ